VTERQAKAKSAKIAKVRATPHYAPQYKVFEESNDVMDDGVKK